MSVRLNRILSAGYTDNKFAYSHYAINGLLSGKGGSPDMYGYYRKTNACYQTSEAMLFLDNYNMNEFAVAANPPLVPSGYKVSGYRHAGRTFNAAFVDGHAGQFRMQEFETRRGSIPERTEHSAVNGDGAIRFTRDSIREKPQDIETGRKDDEMVQLLPDDVRCLVYCRG